MINKEKEIDTPSASLYVGNLHPDVAETFLYELFKEAGSIVSIRVCRDTITQESLGYGYVNFEFPEDAERALTSLNYTVVNDKPIRIMCTTIFTNVYVRNLKKEIDDEKLAEILSHYGLIQNTNVVRRKTGESKGVAFCDFDTHEAAFACVEGLNDSEEHAQEGKKLMVCRSMNKSERVRHFLRDNFAKEETPLYKNPGQQQQVPRQKKLPNLQTLANMEKDEQRNILGNHLFPQVYQVCQKNLYEAEKITGMFLEMDNTDLISLSKNTEELRRGILERQALLREHEAKVHGVHDSSLEMILERIFLSNIVDKKNENLLEFKNELISKMMDQMKILKKENDLLKERNKELLQENEQLKFQQ